MQLNNWVQGTYGSTRPLSWERFQLGPQNAGQWQAIAYSTCLPADALYLLTTDMQIYSQQHRVRPRRRHTVCCRRGSRCLPRTRSSRCCVVSRIPVGHSTTDCMGVTQVFLSDSRGTTLDVLILFSFICAIDNLSYVYFCFVVLLKFSCYLNCSHIPL